MEVEIAFIRTHFIFYDYPYFMVISEWNFFKKIEMKFRVQFWYLNSHWMPILSYYIICNLKLLFFLYGHLPFSLFWWNNEYALWWVSTF